MFYMTEGFRHVFFATEAEARAVADEFLRRTGFIVGIQECRGKGPVR